MSNKLNEDVTLATVIQQLYSAVADNHPQLHCCSSIRKSALTIASEISFEQLFLEIIKMHNRNEKGRRSVFALEQKLATPDAITRLKESEQEKTKN